jgi:hypothetical protein
MVIGACLAYALVIFGGVNLAIPYDYPVNYTDMACIMLCLLLGIGAFQIVMSHLALRSKGRLVQAGLPEKVRLADLTESDAPLQHPGH